MKNGTLGVLLLLLSAASARADFLDNENNHRIEACGASLQTFLKDVPFENDMLHGKSGGASCYLRYFNKTENLHGRTVNNGFVLLTYIDGGKYFSSMEVGMDRDPDVSGIHSIMHGCSAGKNLIQIDTEYVDPFAPTRQERAVLKKDSRGRLISARVRTNLADQTCSFQ